MTTESLDSPALVRINSANDKPRFLEEWKDIAAHSHLLYNLVHRDLTVRYKRSVIGFFWTMLNPLLLMIIFLMVFSALFRFSIKHYEIYFLSEFLGWNFFAQTTVGSMTSIAWNGMLLKRVRVPRSIFALASTLSGLVNLLLSLIPLFAIMLFVGAPFSPALLFLPVSCLVLAVFSYGLSLMLSAMSVYFVDVREMYQVAITGIMYLTPIIYPLSIIPARYVPIVRANPLLYLFELLRAPVYDCRLPSLHDFTIAVFCALVAWIAGWELFRRLSPGFYAHL